MIPGRRGGLEALCLGVLVGVSFAPPTEAQQSTIEDATEHVFRDEGLFCVCGSFPTEESRLNLALFPGPGPLGPPLKASPHVLWFRLPPGTETGRYRISGDLDSVFYHNKYPPIEVIDERMSLDQRKLWEGGQPTTLRVEVDGTLDPLPLKIENQDADHVRLVKGDEQETEVVFGSYTDMVQPIHRGKFRVSYEFTTESCPCGQVPKSLRPEPTPPSRPASRPPTTVTHGPENPIPPPVTYGEEIEACPLTQEEGRLELSQGVWQDDHYFPDQPGKQLNQLTPGLLVAELPMVANRWTRIFGTIRPVGARPEYRRDEVFVRGVTTGTREVPVKLVLLVTQDGVGEIARYDVPAGTATVGAPCTAAPHPVEVAVRAPLGLPRSGPGFQLPREGVYMVHARAVAGEFETIGSAIVSGNVVETSGPSLLFKPIAFVSADPWRARREAFFLERLTRQVEEEASEGIPDFFPVPNESLDTETAQTIRIDVADRIERLKEVLAPLGTGFPFDEVRGAMLLATLEREIEAASRQGKWDRVVLSLLSSDFQQLLGARERERDVSDVIGLAPASKLVLVDVDAAKRLRPPGLVVGHEIIHTAEYLWSSDDMQEDCGRPHYHNNGHHVAWGIRLTSRGTTYLRRHDGSGTVMGPVGRSENWLAQCSYRQLLGYFSAPRPDPPVIQVSGYAVRGEDRSSGVLSPLYQFDSEADLSPDGTGEWAILLRDGSGEQLARFPFSVEWRLPDLEIDRNLRGFSYRVADPGGVQRVDLEGPDGLADSVRYSQHPPQVAVIRPGGSRLLSPVDGMVPVRWEATDADGNALLSTVLYSADRGETWVDLAFETRERSLDVPLDPEATEHRVLVRVTDGARSADATVTFYTEAP